MSKGSVDECLGELVRGGNGCCAMCADDGQCLLCVGDVRWNVCVGDE